MGQINLFAMNLTDNMQEFLTSYGGGDLRRVGAIRILEPANPEDPIKPRCRLNIADLEYNYIVVEVQDPITWNDVDWLYRALVADEHEFSRQTAMRYSVERSLTPPGAKRPRTKVEEDHEWPIASNFRRCLEIPAMALRHFRKTSDPQGHVKVDRCESVLVIEYMPLPPQPKTAEE